MDNFSETLSSFTDSDSDIDALSSVLPENVMFTLKSALSSARTLNETLAETQKNRSFHPFQRLKEQYNVHAEPTQTLDCLCAPENFCPMTTVKELTSISKNMQDNFTAQMSCLSCSDECDKHMYMCDCAYAELSSNEEGKPVFVNNEDKIRSHLQFTDTLLSIDPNTITNQNSKEIAQKLISYYVSLFKY